MLVSVVMVDIGFEQETTVLSINPPSITGMPGDTFTVTIDIANVEDLYTYAFEVHFAPAFSVLIVSNVWESDFLDGPQGPPSFVARIFGLEGILKVGNTLTGVRPGVSGSGTLVTVEFKVVEAGECALTLEHTELHDSTPTSLIPHTVVSSYYTGPTGAFLDQEVLPGRKVNLLENSVASFTASGSNPSSIPLYMRARFDLFGSDGSYQWMHSGQTFLGFKDPTYLYVDGYTAHGADSWTHFGDGPWLDETDDGNYIVGEHYCSFTLIYSFEDITLGPTDVIGRVVVEHYATAADAAIDADVLTWEPTFFDWLGSLEAGGPPAKWISVTNQDPANLVNPVYGTEEGLNALEIAIHYWTPSGDDLGPFMLDGLRLRVEYSAHLPASVPSYGPVLPGETIEFPAAEWLLGEASVGSYYVEVSVWYSYYGSVFNAASKVKTFRMYFFIPPGHAK